MTERTPGAGPPPAEPAPVEQRSAGWTHEPAGWAPPTALTEVPGAPGFAFASVFARLIAYLVDGLIIGLAAAAAAIALGFSEWTRIGNTTFVSVSGTPLSVAVTLVGLVYFVFFWTGGRRATLGQRIFDIQVGNAFDGRPLTPSQAVARWVGLGSLFGVLAILPRLEGIASVAQFVWLIILLVTTAQSSTKQGVHDRFANSAIVRPMSRGSSGATMACLTVAIAVVVLLILIFLAVINTDRIQFILPEELSI